ncbi:MAG: CRTAC1 family protein [Dokdonella sp.]
MNRFIQFGVIFWAATSIAARAGVPPTLGFSEVSATAGVATTQGLQFGPFGETDMISGGVAGGDIDDDGWLDIIVLRGDLGPAMLYRNQGNGTFVNEAAVRGLNISGGVANGVLLADLDGDNDLDVLVGGVYIADEGYISPPRLWRNDGSGHFSEDTAFMTSWDGFDSGSAALGDADGDGDLDLAFGRWAKLAGSREHLFHNNGSSVFSPADAISGLSGQFAAPIEHSFTPNFADIDGDGDADLLYTGDFSTSRVFLQQPGGVFSNATTAVISDENGMGAAVADYDNDGDLDWFVSSIHDPGTPGGNWGTSGNRLYRNDGGGTFSDVTDAAGVRQGYWGWGSCFADFNADGWLDLFMVNGMIGPTAALFNNDPARLFMSNADGTFNEQASALGVADTGQGRGIVCMDYDRDGDIDILVQNTYGATRLFRNDMIGATRTLSVRLRGATQNQRGIGARIWMTASSSTQMREMAAGSNYLSNNPAEVIFGVGATNRYDRVRVRWPGGSESVAGYRAGLARDISIETIFVDSVD